MYRSLILICLISLVCSFNTAANVLDYRYQKAFRVQSLSLDEGLSQSVVNDIIQDSDGFIWVATEDGLNRFDGYEFKIFQQNHNDPDSIHDNLVLSLAEEPGKGIWIGTQNGLSFYDPVSGKFEKHLDKNDDLRTSIVALAMSASGNVYIGSDNGLYVFNQKEGSINLFATEEQFSIEDEISSIDVHKDRLWVASESCVYEVSELTPQVKTLCEGRLGDWLEGRRIKSIRFRNKDLWIATTVGLARYNLDNGELEVFYADRSNKNSLTSNWVQEIAFDQVGNLWIGTAEGLTLYRYSENEFEQFVHMAHDKDGLTSNDIFTIFVDSQGLIWIGTYAAGVNLLDPAQTGFKHILNKSDFSQFNASNTIHGIAKDRDEDLWVASYGGGLVKLDLMTGEVSRPFYREAMEINETYDHTYSLLVDLENNLWVGTLDGIFIIDLDSEQLFETEIIVNNQPADLSEIIFQIYEDHSGSVWIATSEGLYLVELLEFKDKSVTLSLLSKHPEIPNSFRDRSSRISSILETRDGNFWIGGTSGLLLYSPKDNTWRHFEYQSENRQSISNDDVQVIFEDSREILWIGTANGLNKVHRDDSNEVYFERITKEQGLPNNTIYGILEDSHKQLWLSTNLGLVRYSGQSESMQAYRRSDGLSSDEFNTAAFYADAEGLLYFGSINGVTVVDSRVTTELPTKRNLIFTEVKVGQRSLDTYSLNHTQKPIIAKQRDESTIKITVADVFYQKLNTQSYRYRLLGLDENWVQLGKERTFILAGLNEGNYILDIQSRVGNEVWSKNNLRVELYVESDFWKSDDALYLLVALSLLVFSGVIFWIKRYYQQRISKAENLVKIESVRLKEVRKQNDELQIELENRNKEISVIAEKLGESSQLIDSYQFRDGISGFYRYRNVARLLTIKRFDDEKVPQAFNLFAVFQLSDVDTLLEDFGEVCAAEVVNHVANELKKAFPSYAHICSLNHDSFVILVNSSDTKNLTHSLSRLRDKVICSQIPIANNQTTQTRVALSFIELYPDNLNDMNIVVNLCDLLIATHLKNNSKSVSGVMRIDLNKPFDEFSDNRLLSDVEGLIENNVITGHFINYEPVSN